MASKSFLSRQNSNECQVCSSTPPACSCSANEQCILIEQSCNECASFKCISNSSTSSGSKGVGEGAVAGAVVGAVIFLALVIAAFFYYRRRARTRLETGDADESKTDAPARAEDVLNRPDPNEKPLSPMYEHSNVRVYSGSGGIINLDPDAHAGDTSAQTFTTKASRPESSSENPFNDSHSIQTTSTGTQSNVIPIALVTPGTPLHSPMRPTRGPDLDLNTQSQGSTNADAQHPDATAAPNNRLSFMTTLTNGSYASDLLGEAPVIVTPARGTVKQVVGVVKADYIRTAPGTAIPPGSAAEGLRPVAAAVRPSMRSPLASSFGPSDVVRESEEEEDIGVRANPFSDENSLYQGNASQRSPPHSTSTFNAPRASPEPSQYASRHPEEDWVPNDAQLRYETRSPASSRPISTQTNAGSIIAASVIGADIGSATRVHLGLNHLMGNDPATPTTSGSGAHVPNRMTSARLVTPPTVSGSTGALEQQQQRAYHELDHRPISMASVMSTSTRADSILESFPFVPPSPISNRPIRTPPRSPLAQSNFASGNNGSTTAAESEASQVEELDSALPLPPNRKMLGMSVASLSSTVSNGLSSFPFQIDSGDHPDNAGSSPPSSVGGRQRASLDTLALTSDLASYPLGFDGNPPMPSRH